MTYHRPEEGFDPNVLTQGSEFGRLNYLNSVSNHVLQPSSMWNPMEVDIMQHYGTK